jgi:hypothetical protein
MSRCRAERGRSWAKKPLHHLPRLLLRPKPPAGEVEAQGKAGREGRPAREGGVGSQGLLGPPGKEVVPQSPAGKGHQAHIAAQVQKGLVGVLVEDQVPASRLAGKEQGNGEVQRALIRAVTPPHIPVPEAVGPAPAVQRGRHRPKTVKPLPQGQIHPVPPGLPLALGQGLPPPHPASFTQEEEALRPHLEADTPRRQGEAAPALLPLGLQEGRGFLY